jgi:hypothetical protein
MLKHVQFGTSKVITFGHRFLLGSHTNQKRLKRYKWCPGELGVCDTAAVPRDDKAFFRLYASHWHEPIPCKSIMTLGVCDAAAMLRGTRFVSGPANTPVSYVTTGKHSLKFRLYASHWHEPIPCKSNNDPPEPKNFGPKK